MNVGTSKKIMCLEKYRVKIKILNRSESFYAQIVGNGLTKKENVESLKKCSVADPIWRWKSQYFQ